MSREILDEAYRHFKQEGREYEYGRQDKSMTNKEGDGRTDPSRTGQDIDGDGLYGVDCSSLVWQGLKDAGYDVGKSPWGTATLFEGKDVKPYARERFDVISAEDAKKPNGPLEPGDVIMFKSKGGSGQHVGIFKGYDEKGNMQFFGSQVSTGPEMVTKGTGEKGYWNGGEFEIVGALRAKPEARIAEPKHGRVAADAPLPGGGETSQAPRTNRPAADDGVLEKGEKGPQVRALQEQLVRLGITDARGQPLQPDGDFGARTKEAVEAFQRTHGLKADGEVGPKTLEALNKADPRQSQQPAAEPTRGPLLSDAAHPNHAMYQQAVAGLEKVGGFKNHQELERAAATLTYDARVSGLTKIDHVVPNANGTGLFAVQGELGDPASHRAFVNKEQATQPTVEQSTQRLQQDVPEAAKTEQTQTQTPKAMVA